MSFPWTGSCSWTILGAREISVHQGWMMRFARKQVENNKNKSAVLELLFVRMVMQSFSVPSLCLQGDVDGLFAGLWICVR